MPLTEAPATAIQRPLGAFEKLFWRRPEPGHSEIAAKVDGRISC